jgi:hypothetical protein
MVRFAWLALLLLVACTAMKVEKARTEARYTGTVHKVFHVVRQGPDLPGVRYFGRAANILAPALRQNAETRQYIVRTLGGNVIAQSDEEFPVGECVAVIPQSNSSGPVFRYGEATVVRSESCNG